MRVNDYTRWAKVAAEPPRWDGRNIVLGSYVPAGASVLDLGAGALTLQEHLPQGSAYQAVDLIPRDGVIACDFNAGEMPVLPERYDIAVCSGVLEYIVDLPAFLRRLPSVARSAILTYAPRTIGDTRALRARRGWANHLGRGEFSGLLEELDYPWAFVRDWHSQMIVAAYFERSIALRIRGGGSAADVEWERQFTELERQLTVSGPVTAASAEWSEAQRAARRQHNLEAGRIRRLSALPGWTWSPELDAWMDRCAEVDAAAPEFAVPGALRRWMAEQRAADIAGKLTVPQRAALDAVPGWTWDARGDEWNEMAGRLAEYAEREHHTVPAKEGAEAEPALAKWVGAQRRDYEAGALDEGQIAALEAIPSWAWTHGDARWLRGFTALRSFVAREGHAIVPLSHVEFGMPLGRWLGQQRDAYRSERLSDERTKLLRETGALEFDPEETDWQTAFGALHRYAQGAGHASPGSGGTETGELAAWAQAQREAAARGELSDARQARLDRLRGFAWTREGADWERSIASLRDYASVNGHASPERTVKHAGEAIGQWVARQRSAHAAESLEADRVVRLDGLPGWAWSTAEGTFERHFAELERFTREHGFALAGRDHRALERFVAAQRRRRAARELPAVDALRLEGLRGWSWEAPPADEAAGLAAFGRFLAREGHGDVPPAHLEGEYELGAWIQAQAERQATGTIDPVVARLLAPHCPWARVEAPSGWTTGYAAAVDRARIGPEP